MIVYILTLDLHVGPAVQFGGDYIGLLGGGPGRCIEIERSDEAARLGQLVVCRCCWPSAVITIRVLSSSRLSRRRGLASEPLERRPRRCAPPVCRDRLPEAARRRVNQDLLTLDALGGEQGDQQNRVVLAVAETARQDGFRIVRDVAPLPMSEAIRQGTRRRNWCIQPYRDRQTLVQSVVRTHFE